MNLINLALNFKPLSLKTIFLYAYFIFLSIHANAQVKSFEYASGKLSEEVISEIVDHSRKNGTEEWELNLLKDHLFQRLKLQRQDAALGSNKKLFIPVLKTLSSCFNSDFEMASDTGWTLTSGNINGINLPCDTCAKFAGGKDAVVTFNSTVGTVCNAGTDVCTGQKVVAPGGGSYSLLLNNNLAGGKIQKIQTNFMVTASNSIFSYQYLAVLQDGGHPTYQQPYFKVQMTDSNKNAIPCANYQVSASSSITGWNTSPGCLGVVYKGWTAVTVDLTAYLGQAVTLEFIISDCSQGGHYAYAYIDGLCGGLFPVMAPFSMLCVGNSSIALNAPPGFTAYNWSGPGIVGASNMQNVNVNAAGTYTVQVTNACSGTFSLTTNVTSSTNTAPVITVGGSTAICKGQNLLLTASGSATYSWSPNAGGVLTDTARVAPASNSTYTVWGSSGNGCGNYTTQNITVNPLPIVSVSPASYTICAGQTAVLAANNASTYTWSANTGSSHSNTVSIAPIINTTYSVTGTDNKGCKNNAFSYIRVNPKPVADFTMSVQSNAFVNSAINFTDQTSGATISTYQWDFGDGGTSSLKNTMHSYAAAGNFGIQLIVTSNFGCKDTVSKTLEIKLADVIVYNSFSPNGDGLNDVFEIDNIREFSSNHVYIYNRWGQLLWDKQNYDNTSVVWDGKDIKGNSLPAGTYFYIIEIDGKTGVKHWVELNK